MYRELDDENNSALFPKLNKLITCCFAFITTLIFLVSISFYFDITGNIHNVADFQGVVIQVSQSISKSPIKSILISENGCDIKYEKAEFYQWKGTITGCTCSGTITTSCSSSCTIISSQNSQQLSRWRGKQFCLERYTNSFYSKASCPTNYKRCNPYTCVYTTELCPITRIEIVPTGTTSTEYIVLNSGFNIIIHRQEGELSLQALTVTVDGIPCLDNLREPESSQIYPLQISTKGCGVYGSDTTGSSIIQEDSFYNFIVGNQLINLFTNLPNFQTAIESQNSILYQRNQIGYNSDNSNCKTIQGSNLGQIPVLASNILNTGKIFTIVNFVLFGVLLIIVLFEFSYHRGKIQLVVPIYSNLLFLFVFLLNIGISYEAIEIITYYDQKEVILAEYRNIGNSACFSNTNINTIFSNSGPFFSGNLENLYLSSYYSMIFSSLILGIMLILLTIKIIIYYKKEKQEQKPRRKKKSNSNSHDFQGGYSGQQQLDYELPVLVSNQSSKYSSKNSKNSKNNKQNIVDQDNQFIDQFQIRGKKYKG